MKHQSVRLVRDRTSTNLPEGDYRYLLCENGWMSLTTGEFTPYDAVDRTREYFLDTSKFEAVNFLEGPRGLNPQEAIEEVHYRFRMYSTTSDMLNRAHHLTELADAVYGLSTWHEGHDTNSGTMPWEREDEG